MISVWEGAQKPYLYEGTIYQKIGSQESIATAKSIGKMLENRKDAEYSWERMSVLGADIDDLDLAEVRKTMNEYNKLKDGTLQDEEEFLMNEGLLRRCMS